MMKERRKHKRIQSPQPLPVLDRTTGKQLGLLVDLSIGGLLIETKTLLQVGSVYQLQIILLQTVSKSKIELSAEVVWSEAKGQQEIYCAGLLAIEISDYELERIEQLLELWMNTEACVNL